MLKKILNSKMNLINLANLHLEKISLRNILVLQKAQKDEFGSSVKVLFYNDPNDFAVVLTTKSDDEVFLYKNSANKEFNYLYADMLKKQTAFTGSKRIWK